MDILKFLEQESGVIDGTFRDFGVAAWVALDDTVVGGAAYIRYGVALGRAERVAHVERLETELNERLTVFRAGLARAGEIPPARDGSGRVIPVKVGVRWRKPPLALEIDHPAPGPLALDWALVEGLRPGEGLIGKRWELGGPVVETWAPAASPHALFAGMTGAGKSTAMTAWLTTYCAATSPEEAGVVLLDPKNSEMVKLRALPHVRSVGRDLAACVELLAWAVDEMERRVAHEGDWAGPALVVLVDEVADMVLYDKDAGDLLGRIGQKGRSSRVHLVMGTQKPTKDVMGRLAKSQVTVRFVGRVGDWRDAETATGKPGSGAQHLPGRGAFLRVDEHGVERLQVVSLGGEVQAELVEACVRRWGGIKDSRLKIEDWGGREIGGLGDWGGEQDLGVKIEDWGGREIGGLEIGDWGVRVAVALVDGGWFERRGDALPLAVWLVAQGPAVLAGELSKAELIRAAYAEGLIGYGSTGGRNSGLFRDGLAAVARLWEEVADGSA